MRRFITYLYEYNNGKKLKNVGFARVDEREDRVNMELHIRHFHNSQNLAKAYALIWNQGLWAVELSEVNLGNGQIEQQIEFATDNIMDSDYHMEDMVGIAVTTEGQVYLASCWKDEHSEEIAEGQYRIWEPGLQAAEEPAQEALSLQQADVTEETNTEVDTTPQKIVHRIPDIMAQAKPMRTPVSEMSQEHLPAPRVAYRKMELNEIRMLPRRNWRLLNNRFLIHGFFNYGYLVLATEISDGVESAYLGVPGIFEKPEMVVAAVFDFANFKEIPGAVSQAQMGQEMVMEETIKNHNPQEGTFGLWLTPLYM